MKITPLLVLPLMIGQSHAFDAWGFRSGMSEAEAVAVGRREGYEVREPPALNTSQRFHTLAFVRRTAKGTDELGYITSFCDGQLTTVSHDYRASIATLFDLLSDLKVTYGAPTAETSSNMLDAGKARSINFNFKPKPDDVTFVAANLNVNSDTAFGIQVIHHNTEMRCP